MARSLLRAFPIQQLLQQPQQTRSWELAEPVEGFESLTPVQGELTVRHGHSFLEVTATAETIVNLTCDRCLCCYNHRLQVNTRELIWLRGETPELMEWEPEDELEESLPPDGSFDPQQWLYEQLCLALPLRNVCAEDCPGPAQPESESPPSVVDDRWLALAKLRDRLGE
ncbi:YceD family protein [Synechococcus elongatus]|uniref:Metal-binding possibly nucleic acid-binding protein-like n=1 Tax=Synechococcus elongatus (strain ATCC 33912 / PCC 7942 / FACHB-805) TaxID=1140 RepID=Q31MS0_SYNE7|nr:DUF177 domain-containing protein [Synechococcus elongatus]ABB57649.1 metal-binding possibly nucleic acid-binding protein-like [Synechococcus elongatus PCC 7942 = FACHB-805]AJD57989.1 hypothetical protein M744_09165 [Synechococcus elongatus UTEX 2973]MBD2588457.1 DUF177 domain-containing protein [Synechococcus elongatus FACHB-242]MBD2689380.1 DUF177 domain-containing protein [Synechococcus elongatus FACHB-1061]MBD2708201.1 DUF177 domain-containing protein [Synechococcus elongatus PCC 7942 = 